MNVYDPDKESDKVSDFMAEGCSAEAVEAALDATRTAALAGEAENEGDWLLQLFSGNEDAATDQREAPDGDSLAQLAQSSSLFDNYYQFAKAALTQLEQLQVALQWQPNDVEQSLVLTAPLDLQERLRQLPREVQAANDQYTLCADPAILAQAIEQARQARAEEDTWPQLHYLWQQHPVMEWLADRMLTSFGRHCAPLLHSPHLAEVITEAIFGSDTPPRFVILAGLKEWLLLDRFKWPNNRALRFDWDDILDRKDSATLQAAATMRQAAKPGATTCSTMPGLCPPAASATTSPAKKCMIWTKPGGASCACMKKASLFTGWRGATGKKAPVTTRRRC